MQQITSQGEHLVRSEEPPDAALNGAGLAVCASTSDGSVTANVTVPKPRYKFHNENDAHLHTLDGRPLMGTSTVCNIIAKPLVWWAAGMAVTPLGWLNKNKSKIADRLKAAEEAQAKIAAMTPREYAAFLDSDCYRAHNSEKESTAIEGTVNHLGLENYVKECIYENAGNPLALHKVQDLEPVQIFAAWALDNVGEFLWSEAHCYSETMWTGGICDCGAILKDGAVAVGDFKRSKEPYYAQFLQCGGYAAQIKENGLVTCDGEPIKVGEFIDKFDAFFVFPLRYGKVVVRRNVPAFEKAFRGAVDNHNLKQWFEANKEAA